MFRVYSMKKDRDVYFRLIGVGGEVRLMACDLNGKVSGNILTIHSNGSLSRESSVNPNLGLELDGLGRIALRIGK